MNDPRSGFASIEEVGAACRDAFDIVAARVVTNGDAINVASCFLIGVLRSMHESLDADDFAEVMLTARHILAQFPSASVGAPKGDPSEAERELRGAIAIAFADVCAKHDVDINCPEDRDRIGILLASLAGAAGCGAGADWYGRAAEAMAKTAEQPISVHHIDLTPSKKDRPS